MSDFDFRKYSDILAQSPGVEKYSNFDSLLENMDEARRNSIVDMLQSVGEIAPTDEGVLTEAGQGFAQNIISAGAGLGASLQELTGSSAIKDYFQGVLNRNQQWNAPENMGIASYIGRAVGSGAGSTVGTLGAATLGSLVSPGVGTAAGLTAGFMQTFGNNVQRNRKAGYSEDKALGMAFLESGVDTLIENGLGVVGKGTKMAANFRRLQKISAAGKGKLLQQIGRRMVADLGKDKAQNLLIKWAKNSIRTGAEESFEEGLQYINSYLNQIIGGDPNAEFSFDELKESMLQGGIAGTFMGGIQSIPGVRHEAQMRKMQNTPEAAQTAETQTDDNTGFNTLMDEVIRGTGAELGIKVDYIDNYTGNKTQEVSDGFYDPETDTIYLDRNDATNDPGLALGHEIKHFIDRHSPELSKTFDDLWKAGQTEEGKVYFKQLLKEIGVPENEMPEEIGAEVFGMIFKRPGTMKAYAEALNKQNPGMGEKFIQTVLQFFEAIKKRLAGNTSPEAETLFNNVAALEQEAGNILAEVRRRNGTSSQVENVVGAKGNTTAQEEVKEAVVSAENAQTTKEETVSQKENVEPVVKENLTTEKAESNALQKMRDAFANRTELLNKTDGNLLWTDIAREYADGQILSKEADNEVLQEIISMAKEDYKGSESRNILDAISKNSNFASEIHKKAEAAIKVIDKKIENESVRSVKENVKTAPEENTGDEEFFKDRTAELGFSFDEFYKNFKPSLESILAKARQKFSNTLGSDIEAEWESAANKVLVRAYMKYPATGGKAKLKTYASRAVANAITDVNRKHKANFNATGGNISLDQTNEQGEALSEAVADENTNALPQDEKTISYHDEPQKAVRKILDLDLNEVDRTIVDLIYEKDLPTSLVIRKLGKHFGENGNDYMSEEEYKQHLRAIADQAFDAGLRFMRKRGGAIENREIVINTNTSQYQMPSPFNPKELKAWLKSFYKQKEKPINTNTGWTISVPGTGIEETLNHLYRNRKNYRSDLHYLSLPYIDKMLENAEFEKFDEVEQGKNADAISIFNVIVDFGDQGKYNARMVIKHFGEAKNFYDHKLTKFEELSDLELQPEGSGSLNNSSTSINIPQSGEKSSGNLEFMRKRLHQQINPIVVDGVVRQEYQDLLENKEYTPERLKDWGERAMEWIVSHGGVVPAAKEFLKNHAPAEKHVAALARRMIMNSDAFPAGLDAKERTALYEMEIDERSSWGKQGRALQLAALRLEDIASVQALLNKLHKDMPPQDLQKLRNNIKKDMDLDIYDLPENIVNDKAKLDAVLRAHLAHKANFANKIYEYWINAILSGPATHVSNFFGNTANAAYELGIKRFTEALVNTVAGRKDGATFGEFKSMMKAFNWENAWKAAKQAFDLEVLDSEGKFNENHSIAIGGKTGRAVRVPGRLLKAADAFAKAIIQPVEVAAYAHRMGIQQGLTGTKLEEYIQKQLTDRNSKAYQWGNKRAKELSFQEDPGDVINRLVAMRESPGVMGAILKIILPFIKTPANILRQGARKSPLGIVSLAYDTAVRLKNKQGFDGAYIARVAEQIVAFGTVMAFASMGDDDDLPFITGSSAQYGSAEYGFKANRVPPYSIRIGDTWYSYQRIEPLSTGLALIADGIQAFRNAKNGKDGSAVMSDLMRSAKQIAVEKSFLDSFGELNKALDDPQHFAKALTNPVRGFIPNVYTQVRQALDENAQDNKSREKGAEWLKDQFFLVTNRAGVTTALPKIDYFGREVKKDDWGDTPLSPLGRLLPLKRIEADSNFDKAEQLIWNFNQKHPNEAWYPSIPQNTFTINKQRKYLSGEDYQNFAIDAGKLAYKQINNAIRHGYLNVKNPSEKDIELIKKIFARARKEARIKYQSKAKKY